MRRLASDLLHRTSLSSPKVHSLFKSFDFPIHLSSKNTFAEHEKQNPQLFAFVRSISNSASSPSLSIWRRKKEMGKEGLIVAKELKRLQSNPIRLERFIKSHVSRLLKSDLVAVLFEFQRQDQVFLCMKVRSFQKRKL